MQCLRAYCNRLDAGGTREEVRESPQIPDLNRWEGISHPAEFGNTWASVEGKWMGLLLCILRLRFLRDLQVDVSLRTLVVIGKARRDLRKSENHSDKVCFFSAVT